MSSNTGDFVSPNKVPLKTAGVIVGSPSNAQGSLNLNKQAYSIRLLEDKDDNIIGFPVIQVGANSTQVLQQNFMPGTGDQQVLDIARAVYAVTGFTYEDNSASWSKQRGNSTVNNFTDSTTTNLTTQTFKNYNGRGLLLGFKNGTITGTSATVQVNGVDTAGSTTFPLFATAVTLVSATNQYLLIYPGAVFGGANATTFGASGANILAIPAPRLFNIVITKNTISVFSTSVDVIELV